MPARASWRAAAVVLANIVSPPVLLYQGIVWKDVMFADAAVAGFACFAHAAACWQDRARRLAWLGPRFLLLCLAALTRQNCAGLLPFAAAALGWIAARGGMAAIGAILLGAAALAALLAFVFAANALLNLRSDGEPGPEEQLHLLQVYDLAGALAREPSLPLAAMAEDDPNLARAIRGDGVRLYSPVRNDPVMSSPAVDAALRDSDEVALGAAWRALIVEHAWLYLKDRAAVFAWLLFTTDIDACRPVFTGIEGPAPQMRTLGLAPRREVGDLALERYGKAFYGTPVLSHVPFAIIAIGSIWRRCASGGGDIVLARCSAGRSATLSFFVISIACDYRYLYALDLSALAALLYLALDARSAFGEPP